MRYAAAFALIMLGGCASSPSPQQAMQMAGNTPDVELCYIVVSGRGSQVVRQAAYAELTRRRSDCNQHLPMLQARMQAEAARDQAQTNAGLMLLQMSRPAAVTTIPPTRYCRSVNRGTYVETVCD